MRANIDWNTTANIFEETASEISMVDWDQKVQNFSNGPGRFDWSVPEAFMGIILGAAQADLEITKEELDQIKSLRRRARVLKALTDAQVKKANETATAKLRERGDQGLREACQCLPSALRLPVFALALDIVFADGKVTQSERHFIDNIAQWLEIERGVELQIRQVILIKNNC